MAALEMEFLNPLNPGHFYELREVIKFILKFPQWESQSETILFRNNRI
jgi:hypothetical protein